ncbi:hypothetical protein LXG23DRAFT_22392 [Yarrowia lipolytica]|uniref:MutL C-terminal dimerisation domain-containing protein n=1 Tax=Yarrowia lipolytica TaxID=4952 RepID=A0A1D8NA13_YARLL|nr:hypothetical protein YALI1_C09642g [Yarrowia lipolytica]KAB8281232.1 hypothetical protein BKA91DRAFT_140611 [Yarrowia lipolytica]KAE8168755.1 hypothetical protein BKA90DRAFT_143731 [Yarrowia lipolytica]KAJ8053166.1 hypothetical protein LXG23DRAFT_22392 [Yarrowia lipolytica]RMI96002.1 hypothetical protein BD777DRAFT_129349 [Yarrowia lipolytica]
MIRRIPDESRDIIAGSMYNRAEFICGLLNNSITRGARRVTISVLPQLGFTVQDNGKSMTDMRHTPAALDLLGSVAVVTVESHDQHLTLQGHVRSIKIRDGPSSSEGTLITCSSLFYNIPVKRKYALQQRDYDQVIFGVWVELLRFPSVHVTLVSSNQVKLELVPSDSIVDRCMDMLEYYKCFGRRVELGRSQDQELLFGLPEMAITGAVGARGNGVKTVQILLYNGSPTSLKRVEKCLDRFNYVLLVDSYAQEGLSQELVVLELVEEWLSSNERGHKRSKSVESVSRPRKAVRMRSEGGDVADSVVNMDQNTIVSFSGGFECAGTSRGESSTTTNTTLTRFSEFKTISQLEKRFVLILAQLKSPTLICVDQHAADERILTDKITSDLIRDAENDVSQTAEIVPLHLSLNMKHLLKHQTVLNKWGFRFEGGYLNHVPHLAREMDPYQLDMGIKEYLETLENGGSDRAVPALLQQLVASFACRNAIKFGDELTLEECHTMVENLLKTKLPFQCAHGRPSMVPLALI